MFDVLYEVPSAFNTTLAVSARGCIVERLLAFVGYAMKWKETGWESSWTAWATVSEYARGGTTSFMTSRALRCSSTLSQSCRGHKVNIRHQRAARVTAFPVSILLHPSFPSLSVCLPLERVTCSHSWDLRICIVDVSSCAIEKSLSYFIYRNDGWLKVSSINHDLQLYCVIERCKILTWLSWLYIIIDELAGAFFNV